MLEGITVNLSYDGPLEPKHLFGTDTGNNNLECLSSVTSWKSDYYIPVFVFCLPNITDITFALGNILSEFLDLAEWLPPANSALPGFSMIKKVTLVVDYLKITDADFMSPDLEEYLEGLFDRLINLDSVHVIVGKVDEDGDDDRQQGHFDTIARMLRGRILRGNVKDLVISFRDLPVTQYKLATFDVLTQIPDFLGLQRISLPQMMLTRLHGSPCQSRVATAFSRHSTAMASLEELTIIGATANINLIGKDLFDHKHYLPRLRRIIIKYKKDVGLLGYQRCNQLRDLDAVVVEEFEDN